jgi:hypothetical protein
MKHGGGKLAGALLLALAHASAGAHDTWFDPLPGGDLSLSTGNRFPAGEIAVDDQYFARRGCVAADGRLLALNRRRFTDRATLLAAEAGAQTCFVQLDAFDVELPPDKIAVYFDEIRPGAAALAAWEQLRARGLPFRERYVKSARVDIGPLRSAARTGLAMDALRLSPEGALSVRDEAVFQVLKHGAPLAGLPVELVNERSRVGLWLRTDGQGQVRTRLPLPGRWLLRGTELRPPESDPARFDSDFITYAFEVAAERR